MKNNYSIEERNRIVEEYLPSVEATIQRNSALIRAARLDREDVYQQLSLRLILAVGAYDTEQGGLKGFILGQLHDELLNCAKPQARYGLVDAPADLRGDSFVSMDAGTCALAA